MRLGREGMGNIADKIASLKEDVHHLWAQLLEKEREELSTPTATPPRTSYASVLRIPNHPTSDDPLRTNITPQQSDNNTLQPVQINMVCANSGTHDLPNSYDFPTIKKEPESLWEECVETAGIKCRVVRSTKDGLVLPPIFTSRLIRPRHSGRARALHRTVGENSRIVLARMEVIDPYEMRQCASGKLMTVL